MEGLPNSEDYLLTLFEVCEILGKSTRTVSRYVHRRILHPRGIKSRQGTLEYRFSKAEVLAMKNTQDEIGRYNMDASEANPQAAPVASFANLTYPPAIKQAAPVILPGISFPTAINDAMPSQPNRQFRESRAEDTSVVPARTTEPVNAMNAANERPKKEEVSEKSETKIVGGNDKNEGEIITLLKATTEMLRDQLKVKDTQIKSLDEKIGQLIERNRETNILLKGLQDKMVLLEKPKAKEKEHNRAERVEQGQTRTAVVQDELPRPAPAPQVSQNEFAAPGSQDALARGDLRDTQVNGVPNPPASDYQGLRINQDKADGAGKKSLFGKFFG